MSKTLSLAACLALVLQLLPASAARAPADTLRVAVNGDLRSTQFGVNRDGTSDTVMHHVVEGLVAYREDMSVGPLLARKWEVSPDGRQYTFTLRDGARFHNDRPVTAEDVKWAWERMLKPETGMICRSWFDGTSDSGAKIERIEAVTADTVRFTLQKPHPLFLTRMANIACLTGIVHRDSVDAAGKWIAPIGTGPYTIGDWRRNQYVELVRFAGYKALPGKRDGYAGNRSTTVSRIRFVVIGDSSAAKAALLAGDVDVLPTLDLDAFDELSKQRAVKLGKTVTAGWEVMLMQNRDPLLKDRRIRQAIAQAIDREQVAISATRSLGHANPSAVAETSRFFGPEFKRALPYSLESARRLLKEAGYAGEPLKIQTNTQFPFDMKSAIMIQGMLKQAGIRAELEILDWATQFKNYNDGRYQLMTMGMSPRADPSLMFDVVVGNKEARKNAVFDQPEAIAALSASAAETDAGKRRQIFKTLHEAMVQDASVVGLFNQVEVDASSIRRVRDYGTWPLGKPRFWGIELSK